MPTSPFAPRIIISGGGTGGHVFPAIAIADAFRKKYPSAEILFVGALGRMEMERVPKAGYKIVGLPIRGLKRSLSFANFGTLFYLLKSFWLVRRILANFQPHVAIGVGGYASFPVLWIANKRGIPTLIQEQNSCAGLANRWLAKGTNTMCVAYQGMERFFHRQRVVITGNPVRQALCSLPQRSEALSSFRLTDRPTLFIMGGSLGARTINEATLAYLDSLLSSSINVIWQTGKYYYEEIKKLLPQNLPDGFVVQPFFEEMNRVYAVADLVISRAGALAVSELATVAKAVVFVPSPNVTADHQTYNAQACVAVGGAVLIADDRARKQMIPVALNLLQSPEKCIQMGKELHRMAFPKAAEHIVSEIERLLKKDDETKK